jgi:hypothetical protein
MKSNDENRGLLNLKKWDLLSNYKSYQSRFGLKYYVKKTADELAAEDIV